MSTITVTDASFAADVLQSDKPVVVDFWAQWCGPCRMIAPALEELSTELGDKVTIAKIDIDANPDVAGKMGVRSIPLLKIFKNGQEVSELLGARPKSALKAWIENEVH